MPFEMPIVTVDAVIMTLIDNRLHVMLARRTHAPFEGVFALPGGFIHVDADISADHAAHRVIAEKCGIVGVYLEQLETFSGPDRDPRGWSVSIAHIALVPRDRLPEENEDLRFFPVEEIPDLAFDHDRILTAALRRLRGKGAWSTLPAAFLGETFTLSEMQRAYEAVLGEKLNLSAFRRKIADLELVEETGEMSRETRRPAALHRLRAAPHSFDRMI